MKKILAFTLLAALLCACGQDSNEDKKHPKDSLGWKERVQWDIDTLEKSAMADFEQNLGRLDMKVHKALADKLLEFAESFPSDSLSIRYMFKAARIYEELLKDKKKAVELYSNIYNDFPGHSDRPMAVFYQANAYHDMGDTTTAIRIFNFFIENHPEHPFADDARGMINFIRMDETQMEKFFEKAREADQPS